LNGYQTKFEKTFVRGRGKTISPTIETKEPGAEKKSESLFCENNGKKCA